MTDNKLNEFIQKNIEMLDYELYALLTRINRVKGIKTTSSCFGHNETPCIIFCEADSLEILHKFMYDYFYGNELWKFELYLTDTLIDDEDWGKVQFFIQSDPRYISYPTPQLMVTNLTRLFELRQIVPGLRDRLKLEVDDSIVLEDVIKEQCEKEFAGLHVVEGE